ncbi:hypothetical protein A2U17_00330 [Fusobacterium necrophorum subsp. funduliforme]|uniref:hypothetical protein n=1 Tax=Fusobacterium necrophorum TaxID=859 RepID=UPI0007886363|nr:hypothetical protein [Fusobacterium necrophorum]KYM56247.1 hypothetical protein A2U17_00330 [Fusobacterium necrophorum subsp. funduliforme]
MKKIAIVLFLVMFIACKNTEIQAKKEVMIEKERIPVTTTTLSKERIEDKKIIKKNTTLTRFILLRSQIL